MEKRQKSVDGAQDRLSELPDSLILEIFAFLEMRDAVATDLLSKRWKGLWTATRCLYFDESEKNEVRSRNNDYSITHYNGYQQSQNNAVRCRNFINRALMLWKGTKILKFKIILRQDMANLLSGDMNLWVRFATAREVEELYLQFPCNYHATRYRPPECLYSCSSISKLTLIGYVLDVRENVRWDRLKSFTFHASRIDDDNLISHVVSGAPQLENFELHLLRCYGNVSIGSTSLKKLSIIKHFDIKSGKNDKSMTIWAPKLEALGFSGAAYRECLLMDVPSLTEATLDFTDSSREVELTLQQILPIIQHVGAITLSANCIKMMMGVMKGISLNAKFVRVSVAPIELAPKHIVHRLGFFPMLKMLIIDLNATSPNDQDIGEPVKSDAYIRKALLQLTRVEIIWYSYEASMFQFIEFLLERATMLEKIVIKKGKEVKSEDMYQAAKKVMSLQRSFPTVYMILDTE